MDLIAILKALSEVLNSMRTNSHIDSMFEYLSNITQYKGANMRHTIKNIFRGILVVPIILFPMNSGAILPLMFGKDILQNIIFGEVRDQMIGSLSSMGCKGTHLAGLIASANAAKTSLPGGGMPMNMPDGINMPGAGMAMQNGMNSPTKSASMRAARGGIGIPSMTPEQAQAMMANGMPDPAMISQLTGRPMSPEEAAQMQNAMAGMQEAMSHPLSRTESIEVFDQLADMGLMTNEMRGEVHDCIMLAPSGSESALGSSAAMIKTMVLPKLHETKQRLDSLSPEEQNQLADSMVDALQHASAKDRNQFLNGFGTGFFPAPVVEKVRSKITGN